MNKNIQRDFQICISLPLSPALLLVNQAYTKILNYFITLFPRLFESFFVALDVFSSN